MPSMTSTRGGLRQGVLGIPFYFVAVGAGHIWLALQYTARTEGMARDGQAFSGGAVLGVGFIFLGLITMAIAIGFERSGAAFARGAAVGLAVAAAVVAYTAIRTAIQGYDTGGTPGELRCIVEQGRELCPPGDGTWIRDARLDPTIMLVASLFAYLVAHAVALGGGLRVLARSTAR